MPCGFLADVEIACNLVAADSVFAVHNEPNGGHPFVHAERRVFENGSDLYRELFLAALAEPDASGRNERMPVSAAAWACDLAVRPAQFDRERQGAVRVCEIGDSLL